MGFGMPSEKKREGTPSSPKDTFLNVLLVGSVWEGVWIMTSSPTNITPSLVWNAILHGSKLEVTPKSCSGVGTSFDFTSILYTLYLSGFLVIVGTTVKVAVIWALGVFLLYVQKTLSTSNSNCMKLLLRIISSFDELIFSGKILVHPGDWVFPQPDMATTHQPELAGQQAQGLKGVADTQLC